jgi:Spy/CpxP family protein refolding chaperone
MKQKENFMKKTLRTIVLGLAGLLVAISLGGCERGWGPKGHSPGYILKKVDSEVKELGLTAEQQTKYQDIRSRLEVDVRKHMDTMNQLHSDLEKDPKAERPDVNAMAAQLKKRFADEGDPRQKLVDYFVEFYNILNPDQQKKLIDHIGKERRCFNWHS